MEHTTNIRIINLSSRSINDEILEAITFQTLSEANTILAQYNMKIREFEQIFNDGQLQETVLTIGDTKETDIY